MKKDCEIVKDLLPLYIDGVCSKQSKEMVEKHIKSCEECQKLEEQMKANLEIPIDTDKSDVKGFKKFIKKRIWVSVIAIVLVLVIGVVALNWGITLRWSEIWPKADADGIQASLEIVTINDVMYLHQSDLFGFGQVVDISSPEDDAQGIMKFYLGEQGITTLDPRGMSRMWIMEEKYTRLEGDKTDGGIQYKKIIYCHKDGTEVVTLWEEGMEQAAFTN